MKASTRRATGPLVLLALVIFGAVGVSTAVARIQGAVEGDETGNAVAAEMLQRELDSMLAGGMPADHPKVRRLREDLLALRDGAKTSPPGEPGLDLSSSLGPRRGGSREVADDMEAATDAVVWDRGDVECEPIPPDQLTAVEVANARCISAPQPDGTARYVALDAGGMARVVRFTATGQVTRQPDIQIDLLGTALQGLDLTVDLLGQLVITVSGTPGPSPIAVIDLS